jgi:hypothetical protein
LNLLFTALLMLCGLGAAIFATNGIGKRETLGFLALGFVSAAMFIRPEKLPDPAWIGGIVAAVAALRIFRPHIRWPGLLCGGALAGLWTALLEIQGLPLGAAMILAGIVPSASAYLTHRRAEFAPEALREEAMLALVALGLAVAIIPEVSAGWQSALALNREAEAGATGPDQNQIIANWVLVLSAASVVLGGLYSLLRRR